MTQVWTVKKISDSAKKYKSVKEWIKHEPLAYAAASRRGLLPKLTKKMHKEIVANDYWNKETIKEIALKFKTTKEWYSNHMASYQAAQRRNLLSNKEITGHMKKIIGKPITKWTAEKILIDAQRFKSKSQWKANSPQAYKGSKKLGIFEKAVKHMHLIGSKYNRCLYSIKVRRKKIIYIGLTYNFEDRIKAHLKTKRFKKLSRSNLIIKQLSNYIDKEKAAKLEIQTIKEFKFKGYILLNTHSGGGLGGSDLMWTKEKIIQSAKKFNHKMKWKESEPGAYASARKKKILNEVTSHMKILNPKGKWTRKTVISDALKYSSRSQWMKQSSGAYESAKNNGWFDNAVKHMVRPDMTMKWTIEKIKIDALKFKTKKHWHNHSSGAYGAAKKKGIFEEVTQHMKDLIKK